MLGEHGCQVCFDMLSRLLSLFFSQGLKLNMALRSEGSQERRKSLRSESSGQDAGEMVTV